MHALLQHYSFTAITDFLVFIFDFSSLTKPLGLAVSLGVKNCALLELAASGSNGSVPTWIHGNAIPSHHHAICPLPCYSEWK